MPIEDKVKDNTACAKGNHTFVPAVWKLSPSSRTCTLFVCQHCLMSVDKSEWETMASVQNEKLKKKPAKPKA